MRWTRPRGRILLGKCHLNCKKPLKIRRARGDNQALAMMDVSEDLHWLKPPAPSS